MSSITSPSTLFTIHNSSKLINAFSLLRIGVGAAGFLAPTFLSQRVFSFRSKDAKAVSGSTSGRLAATEEVSISLRLAAGRDVALGLLLRDSSAVVVARALQVGVIADGLDVVAALIGFVEGSLTAEIASAVGSIAAVGVAIQLFILNRA